MDSLLTLIIAALFSPVLILVTLLILYAISYEFQDRNAFVSNAGRMVYTPYLIITKESVGNTYSIGFEAGWMGKWFGVQWNFLDVHGRETDEIQYIIKNLKGIKTKKGRPEQCPECHSMQTTPIGTIGADYVACNICGHTWAYEFKKEVAS